MRDRNDFDEIVEDDSDQLFSLDEIMSEHETSLSEGSPLSEEERSSLLRDVQGQPLTEGERDELVRHCSSLIEISKQYSTEIRKPGYTPPADRWELSVTETDEFADSLKEFIDSLTNFVDYMTDFERDDNERG